MNGDVSFPGSSGILKQRAQSQLGDTEVWNLPARVRKIAGLTWPHSLAAVDYTAWKKFFNLFVGCFLVLQAKEKLRLHRPDCILYKDLARSSEGRCTWTSSKSAQYVCLSFEMKCFLLWLSSSLFLLKMFVFTLFSRYKDSTHERMHGILAKRSVVPFFFVVFFGSNGLRCGNDQPTMVLLGRGGFPTFLIQRPPIEPGTAPGQCAST